MHGALNGIADEGRVVVIAPVVEAEGGQAQRQEQVALPLGSLPEASQGAEEVAVDEQREVESEVEPIGNQIAGIGPVGAEHELDEDECQGENQHGTGLAQPLAELGKEGLASGLAQLKEEGQTE